MNIQLDVYRYESRIEVSMTAKKFVLYSNSKSNYLQKLI